MNLPGFSAQASLYPTDNQYFATGVDPSKQVVPQLAVGLSPGDLYICRLACAYCRWIGYGCFTCWYCAIIISMGGISAG
jgi:hypothetical protein